MTVINTNVSATLASSRVNKNDRAMTTSVSTDLRINSASDDAGDRCSDRSQVEGLEQAARNANDSSMIQVAEGAYVEVSICWLG